MSLNKYQEMLNDINEALDLELARKKRLEEQLAQCCEYITNMSVMVTKIEQDLNEIEKNKK